MCTDTHFYSSSLSHDLLIVSPQLRLEGGAIFVFRAKISLRTAKKHAILHTFQASGGAIAPFAPPP